MCIPRVVVTIKGNGNRFATHKKIKQINLKYMNVSLHMRVYYHWLNRDI